MPFQDHTIFKPCYLFLTHAQQHYLLPSSYDWRILFAKCAHSPWNVVHAQLLVYSRCALQFYDWLSSSNVTHPHLFQWTFVQLHLHVTNDLPLHNSSQPQITKIHQPLSIIPLLQIPIPFGTSIHWNSSHWILSPVNYLWNPSLTKLCTNSQNTIFSSMWAHNIKKTKNYTYKNTFHIYTMMHNMGSLHKHYLFFIKLLR